MHYFTANAIPCTIKHIHSEHYSASTTPPTRFAVKLKITVLP